MIEDIRKKAFELLAGKKVDCFIGYERGTDGVNARPAFVYRVEDLHRLVFDKTCTHNLAKYLLNRKGKKTAVLVKPCDSRAINLLLVENQVERDDFYAIGVVCDGIYRTQWGKASDQLQPRCERCNLSTPPLCDYLVGEPIREKWTEDGHYADVAEMEKMAADDRRAFWEKQAERCIRCYSCRSVCPGCYCSECFVDRLDPEWVGVRIATPQNSLWHEVRAFHLAGRCVGCNECERVCIMDIPLSLLNRKLEKDVWELFQFRSGISVEKAPLATFKKEEDLDTVK